MRYFEINETTTRKPQITLRHLNRLKHIRRRNKMEHDQNVCGGDKLGHGSAG